ncbi:TatD family hydrolase [Ferrimonas gelatinilytica]|uniref:Metal-dependent hydrolase n=1 Tax=Ferrimonas gelatinilytica TaxID=1255257 RepID=A0ABP9RTE7_9GAMM
MKLVDSHCHLDLPPLAEEYEAVLARAEKLGVQGCLIPAVQRGHWSGLERRSNLPKVAVAIGLHPCFAHRQTDLDAMAQRLQSPHPYVAIGECGLDKVSGVLPMAEQVSLCEAQLGLARRHELPIILHVRQAHNELLALLKRHPPSAGGVIHAFSGSPELAKQYLRHGLKLGIGGVITYPRAAKTRNTVAQLPADSLLLETDSPDMPLEGFQGQANEPARLPRVLSELARLRSVSENALCEQILNNTRSLFPRWHGL